MRLWTDWRWVVGASVMALTMAGSVAAQGFVPTPDPVAQEAREAWRVKDRSRLTASRDAMVRDAHPLAPWADYWLAQLRLVEMGPAEADEFMARWGEAYVADRFRNDWLLEAGRRKDWTTFLRVQPAFRMNDDREVVCLGVLARHHSGTQMESRSDLREQARRAWSAQKEADYGCDQMAQALVRAGVLETADVWLKLRLAMDAQQTKALTQSARLLPDESGSALARIMGQAQAWLMNDMAVRPASGVAAPAPVIEPAAKGKPRKLSGKARKEEARKGRVPVAPAPAVRPDHIGPLNLLAFQRWAQQDPEAAAQALSAADASRRWRLSDEEQSWAWASIGRAAAFRLMPQAIAWFEKALVLAELSPRGQWPTDWHPDTLAWMARAALRSAVSGQPAHWVVLDTAVNAMPVAQQQEAVWVYWRARSMLALAPSGTAGDNARRQGREMLGRIAGPSGFYGLLAHEDLHGQPLGAPARPVRLSAQEMADAAAVPGIDRALRLFEQGWRSEGAREWNYTLSHLRPGGMNDRELLATAELGCRRELWDRCINTSERTRSEIDLQQRFPTPFRQEILKAAGEVGLDPAYMFGLIRQESRFQVSARSVVGAAGLMQVMPATGQWVARKLGMSDYRADLITDRDVNLKLGAGYLKLVLDDLSGSQAMAAAAYNAGPGRPRRWREGPRLESAAWAENVPFNETRDYVKKVVTNAVFYGHVLQGKPLSVKARLGGTIGPRAASLPPENLDLP